MRMRDVVRVPDQTARCQSRAAAGRLCCVVYFFSLFVGDWELGVAALAGFELVTIAIALAICCGLLQPLALSPGTPSMVTRTIGTLGVSLFTSFVTGCLPRAVVRGALMGAAIVLLGPPVWGSGRTRRTRGGTPPPRLRYFPAPERRGCRAPRRRATRGLKHRRCRCRLPPAARPWSGHCSGERERDGRRRLARRRGNFAGTWAAPFSRGAGREIAPRRSRPSVGRAAWAAAARPSGPRARRRASSSRPPSSGRAR